VATPLLLELQPLLLVVLCYQTRRAELPQELLQVLPLLLLRLLL
jgi:hypothetical protein